MGDIFIQTEDNLFAIETALYVQKETAISVSATFNNIEVRPDQKNLDIWIKNFRRLYDSGIRSCTLPHTHWMRTGQVKAEFPELFVKNTILRNVSEARDVAHLAEAGFDYINLDRDLMRDHDRLREIKKVKDKYNVKISLLANEGCLGGCPVMDEHFQFNNTRTGAQYFNDPISRVSCPQWDTQDKAIALKTANFPPWREDWIELLQYVDTIKMHGRESAQRLFETMNIIKKFANDEEILFDTFNQYLKETGLENRPIDTWRKKIKTCKFDCWDCNYCDKVWHAKGNTNNKKVEAVANAIVNSVNIKLENRVEGLTSNRTRQLLNKLAQLSTSYLEIGVLNGGTFCSVLDGNQLKTYAVDNWKEETQAANGSTNIKASKQTFIENVRKFKNNSTVKLFDSNFLNVDKSEIDNIDMFFYDADHSHEMTSAAVRYFSDKFVDESILIFDDANFDGVVSGAKEGIKESGLNIIYEKMMLNNIEDPEQWWNGIYICVVRR
jgi:sugar phosphate isomerase/epimerase